VLLAVAANQSRGPTDIYDYYQDRRLLHPCVQTDHDSEYLNESIAYFVAWLKCPRAHWLHFDIVTGLSWSLSFQFLVSKDRKGPDEIMRLYSIAVTDSYAKISDRFRFSCHWAQYARAHKHPSISTAYEIAASLMQDTLTFAPTLEIQHSRLISMRNEYEKLPLTMHRIWWT